MPKVLLDLDFASDLFLNPGFYNLLLVEALEGKDIVRFDLCPNHINVPKSAFTQGATNIKIIQVPIPGWPVPVKGMRIGHRGREDRSSSLRITRVYVEQLLGLL